MNSYEVFATDAREYGGISFYARSRSKETVVTKMVVTEEPLKGHIGTESGPLATLDRATVQSLLNELWRLGFRPNNGEHDRLDVAASLKASDRHIEFAEDVARQLLKKVVK